MFKSLFLITISIIWNSISFATVESKIITNDKHEPNDSLFVAKRNNNEENNDWKFESEVDGIKIESKKVECTNTNLGFDRELVLLRFTNFTDRDLLISYDYQEYRNEICTTCDKMPEYRFQLMLKSNSSIEGDCLNTRLSQLKIFSHFLDSRFRREKDELTDFKFSNIIVLENKNIKK
jgi:hypothetical protein